MSIVQQLRLTLLGPSENKEAILARLQYLGLVHLIEPKHKPKNIISSSEYARELQQALSYLLGARYKRLAYKPDKSVEVEKLLEQVLQNRRARRETLDHIDFLQQRCEALQPWGYFDYPSLDELDHLRLWFYKIPVHQLRIFAQTQLPWAHINSDRRFHYMVVIAREEPDKDTIPFVRTHTGESSLVQIQELLYSAEQTLEQLEIERVKLTRWIFTLNQGLATLADTADLREAEAWCSDDGDIFSVHAWIPKSNVKALQELIPLNAAWQLRSPVNGEKPPTLFENPPPMNSGSDIIRLFQMPGYHAVDASAAIFISFSLFFAVIISDAGYSLLFSVVLILLRGKLNKLSPDHQLWNLGCSMAACGVLYGILVGSYFGVPAEVNALLAEFQLLDINNITAMIQLSVAIGVLHLVLAHAMVAWQQRASVISLSRLGWISLLIGAYVGWLVYLGNISSAWVERLVIALCSGGVVSIVFFSDDKPLHNMSSFLKRGFSGLKGLYSISRAFTDVLSYIRLFALGLASASLAVTFNEISASIYEQVPGLGILFAILVLILGHALNFALAIMSGVIHGLRLNLLEFNSWAVSEDGYAFKKFRKREVQR